VEVKALLQLIVATESSHMMAHVKMKSITNVSECAVPQT
jgi:hypothetical protein